MRWLLSVQTLVWNILTEHILRYAMFDDFQKKSIKWMR